jgi:hypothetical protein
MPPRIVYVTEHSSQLSAGDALVVLLTVATLLVAVFAVGAAFSETTEFGRPLPTSVGTFGTLVAVAITAVGIGAGAAWWDAYINGGIRSVYQAVEAVAIMVGLVSEIAFAWWIAAGLRES